MKKEIIKLYSCISKNKDILKKLNIDENILIKILELYETKDNNTYNIVNKKIYSEINTHSIYYPIGLFNVFIEEDNFYNFFEIILTLFLTKNSANFNIKNDNRIEFIIKLFNELSSQDKFTLSMIKKYNNTLCVGTKKFYEEIMSKTYTNVLFIPANEIVIYKDNTIEYDIPDKNINQLNVVYYNNLELEEVIETINNETSLYKSIIFSSNQDNIQKFINNVNSKYILVNILSNDNFLDIDLNKFLCVKNIILKRGI
jgi:hypothetical protein